MHDILRRTIYSLNDRKEKLARFSLKAAGLNDDPSFLAIGLREYLPTKKLTVQQAVALSVGINPKHEFSTLTYDERDVIQYATGDAQARLKEFFERCKLIRDHLHERSIPVLEVSPNYLFHKVMLDDVLSWVETIVEQKPKIGVTKATTKPPGKMSDVELSQAYGMTVYMANNLLIIFLEADRLSIDLNAPLRGERAKLQQNVIKHLSVGKFNRAWKSGLECGVIAQGT
ncbi:hypothetical protein F6R98_10445 [Candidatus Methylospira mobilis]|uniref:Uncharacterized protein n=1 Tax=Candidatus Methylospira mobilis TaxID=1808979 RepID=A0A5Q0BIN9_9GAMM|nr:hypothetical protein [Candidatus Methylospira mobilis]QFY42982.1 hypothetical protein F6R98_10445 [Candidatus Methylospira mobilis]